MGGARRFRCGKTKLRLVSFAAVLALILALCLCGCSQKGAGEKIDTVTDNAVESSSIKNSLQFIRYRCARKKCFPDRVV